MKRVIPYFYTLLLLAVSGCGVSEDCFKGNGAEVWKSYAISGFSKIKVYSGVGLVIQEGADYEVRLQTTASIQDDIEVTLDGNMLKVKDVSSCNLNRDYGQTTLYVTVPDGSLVPRISELELHSKTEQTIRSANTLKSAIIRLYSIDLEDGAGTGDFNIAVENNQLVVESNNVSNFYLRGESQTLNFYFSWGDGIFAGQDLKIKQHISLNHRGSNDVILYPEGTIIGNLYSSGNVILKNQPASIPNIVEHYTGKVILGY